MKNLYFSIPIALTFIAYSSFAASIKVIGVDFETNDAWRSSDIIKPFIDEDNIYGTDGYFIAQYPNGNEKNTLQPPYAEITLVPGKGYEGVGAEQYQAKFDDVTKTGSGDVEDLVCGDYWANSGPTGTLDDFFEITLTQDTSFRLGIITDNTPDGPPGLYGNPLDRSKSLVLMVLNLILLMRWGLTKNGETLTSIMFFLR